MQVKKNINRKKDNFKCKLNIGTKVIEYNVKKTTINHYFVLNGTGMVF